MRRKFLKAVLIRSTDAIMLGSGHRVTTPIWEAAYELINKPDAIADQAQAHGEGRLQNGKSKSV